jgi:hypothetical protein
VLCCIFVAQLALSVVQLEAKVTRLAELLANVISDTKGRVEKKQAQVGKGLCSWGSGFVKGLASCLAAGQVINERNEFN